MKNLLYFQSGGPTSVINTSLYGVIKEAKKHPEIGDYLNWYEAFCGEILVIPRICGV